jgi:predicted DNA-binding transcriptional regulator AlpA
MPPSTTDLDTPQASATEPLVTLKQVAAYVGLTEPGVYNAIKAGRLPMPVYPLPRAPRWRLSEIDKLLERTRTSPTLARAERRQARLEKLKAGTPA